MIYKTNDGLEIKKILDAMGCCKEVVLSVEMEDGVCHTVSGLVLSSKVELHEGRDPIRNGKEYFLQEMEFEIMADLPKQKSVSFYDGQQ